MTGFIKNLVVCICLLSVAGICFAVSEDELAKIKSAAPEKASATAAGDRKVLVFSFCQGFKHSSIPYCSKAIEVMGKKTGAYTSDDTMDKSVFNAENLKQYDAIVFNNTTRLTFDKAQRKAIMDFVKGGKGIVGIHAATDNFYQWPEAAEMMGGTFDGHPWTAGGGNWAVKIEDPKNPVAGAFQGRDFRIRDEIYRTKQINLRKNARVIVGLDMSDETNLKAKGIRKKDVDIPISWLRDFGKGRVFYCAFGHNHHIYWTPSILRHYLDGIQFALGDLKADTTPVPFEIKYDMKSLLNDISGYQYGKSRKGLTRIEDIIQAVSGSSEKFSGIESDMIAFLATGATSDSKLFVCRQLSLIGTEKSVPTLAAMLSDDGTSDMALLALERIDAEQVDQVLLKALDNAKGLTRVGIVNTLGVRKASQAVDAIARQAFSSDNQLATAAVAALGKIATADAADKLQSAVKKVKSSLKPLVEDALLSCAEAMLANGKRKKAFSIYKKVNRDTDSSALKTASFAGMVMSSGKKTADVIADAVKSDNQAIRTRAISLAGRIKTDSGLRKVFKTLAKLSSQDQIQLLLKAGQIDSPVAVDAVFEYAQSSDQQVRIAAITAMKETGSVDAVKVLAEIAAASASPVKNAARNSLYGLSGDDIDEAILKLIDESENMKVVTELVMAAGQRHIEGAVGLLAKQTASSDTNLSRQAFKSLAVVSKKEDLPQLVDLLVNLKTQSLRSEAEKTVAAVIISKKAGIKPVSSAIKAAKDQKAKASLMAILGKSGSPEAVQVLRKGLDSSDENVKTAAIRAISATGDGTVAHDLFRISKTSPNNIHKVLAFRGFVKSIPLKSTRSTSENLELYRQAIEAASNSAEKKLVLSSLSGMPSTQTLEMAGEYLDNNELKSEAAVAVLQISKKLGDSFADNTRGVLKKSKTAAANESMASKIQEYINHLERFGGFVPQWKVAGPFTAKDGDLFNTAFAPEDVNSNDIKWKTVLADKNGVVDLLGLLGGNDRAAYLAVKAVSDKPRIVRFGMGSDDGIKLWVNGKIIHSKNIDRPLKPNQDKVNVSLNEGENSVLVKITQGNGQWGMSLRITDTDGSKIEGVKTKI